jgi:(1->4)-alpha-D-glucan 1-alpha-D-glucosylmutase
MPSRATIIPRATYRMQFNRDFTFAQAGALASYLAALGISHCYASPYLRARPGSTHGYDIVGHAELNPEIGTTQEFEDFAAALKANGLSQVIDVVPNHMGIMGSDNAWWLDVLENGPASAWGAFFDIDWDPLNRELKGKVLLPLLGAHYGQVLNAGELRLDYDAVRGEFSIFYYQHRLPVDPASYPRIIGHRRERLAANARREPRALRRTRNPAHRLRAPAGTDQYQAGENGRAAARQGSAQASPGGTHRSTSPTSPTISPTISPSSTAAPAIRPASICCTS